MPIFRHLKRFSLVGLTVCAGCSLKWTILNNKVLAADVVANTSENKDNGLQLRHVQILFRHGARTPLHLIPGVEQATYPVDMLIRNVPHTMVDLHFVNIDGQEVKPSKYDSYYEKLKLKGGSTGGLLTSYGQDQMFLLGKRLKKDYIDTLNFLDTFDPKLVKLKSTHMRRTKDSLRCVLAGFFGAENLRKQAPLVVETNDTNNEILVPSPNICPVFRQINHSAMIHGMDMSEFKEDKAVLEQAIGKDNLKKKRLHFIDVRDDLFGRKTHGLPLPNIVTPEIFTMVEKNAARLMYFAQCGQHEAERLVATRLSIGRLIKLFQDNIRNTVKGESDVKMHMYSAHDSTVLPVLAVLDLNVADWPPFAADLVIELYEDSDNKHFIKVKYLGQPQIIRGCDTELCSLEKFIEIISPYTIDEEEFNQVCHSNILELIAKEMLDQEIGEVEDEESKDRSDMAAGL